MSLPQLEDLNTPLSHEQLDILKQQVLSEGDYVSTQSQFNYAWGLIKSRDTANQKLGVKILTDLYQNSPQRRRECLFYLALATFKLGDYKNARRYINSLVDKEPDNQQFISIQKTIDNTISKDGLVGMALVSGVVAAGAAALTVFLTHNKRK